MALDNVSANGLKTVYTLSHQPFSSDLKKELEGKIQNLQKKNQTTSNVVPFTPEYLSEIKTQDLMLTHAAEKAKKSNIATWVFLSLTVATIALAILFPMIALPLAAVFAILTITASVLHVKNSSEKNKALTNLANSAFENLPELAKVQENKKSPNENPFEILFRTTPAQISLNPSSHPTKAQNNTHPANTSTTTNPTNNNTQTNNNNRSNPVPPPTSSNTQTNTNRNSNPTAAPTNNNNSSNSTTTPVYNNNNNSNTNTTAPTNNNNSTNSTGGTTNNRSASPSPEPQFTSIELASILNQALAYVPVGPNNQREALLENSPIIAQLLSYLSDFPGDEQLSSALFTHFDALTENPDETNTIFANLISVGNNGVMEPRFETIDDFMLAENGYLLNFGDEANTKLYSLRREIYGEDNNDRNAIIQLLVGAQRAVRYVLHSGHVTADDVKAALFEQAQGLIIHATGQPLGNANTSANQAIDELANALAIDAAEIHETMHDNAVNHGAPMQNYPLLRGGAANPNAGHISPVPSQHSSNSDQDETDPVGGHISPGHSNHGDILDDQGGTNPDDGHVSPASIHSSAADDTQSQDLNNQTNADSSLTAQGDRQSASHIPRDDYNENDE